LGAVGVAAAAIVAALFVDTSTTQQPSGSIETVAVQQADIEAALADPRTRTGTFRGVAATGNAALEAGGNGFVYDLTVTVTEGSTTWMWLETSDGDTVRVGELPEPETSEIEFVVDGDVDAVRALVVSIEQAGLTPAQPSDATATASLE
jgi:hypothetical protein